MRRISCIFIILALCSGAVYAAGPKGIRFWNLTSETQNEVSLAPSGSGSFGPNQCLNDKDGNVDTDEQLRITGIAPGLYDVRLHDTKGRVCYAHNVLVGDGVFSLQDKDLTECTP